MRLWGLHAVDAAIILVYFIFLIWVGKRLQRRMRDREEYFLAGRRMGRLYQFFLNFGSSTDASQAAAVSREIYRQGIAGMWIQYIVLFLTPFYWFMAMLLRRARVMTLGDLFTERFESRFLGGAYAVFFILIALIGSAVGYMVAAKTFMALTPKPESAYTMEERLSVQQYQEYRVLRSLYQSGELPPEKIERYRMLQDLNDRGELRAFVSYVKPWQFYLIYGGLVCIYVVLGGFAAAAVTDVLQGVLMILFSAMLIPFGLAAVGGFAGLHRAVPQHMFQLFGSETLSEYAWYTIAAMALANLVSIIAVAQNMHVSGSAVDENTARFGMIGGLMFKRVIMIFWALAGLIAVALYSGQLHDPDLIWGYMTRRLLGPGFIGVMMVGVLAANMSTLDAQTVALSALFVNQVYRPLLPGRSERHYLHVSRIVIVVMILGGIAMALYVRNLLELFKYFIAMPAIFGAPIWLAFMWRRLTRSAVVVQIIVSFGVMAVIPNLFPSLDWARRNPRFLQQTEERRLTVFAPATEADVLAGRAQFRGQSLRKIRVVPPYPIFFESIVHERPGDPASPRVGVGRFNAELWLLSWSGIDLKKWRKSQLVAARFLVDALLPVVLLIVVSLFTRPNSQRALDRFYAKIHTPVQPTADADARAVEHTLEDLESLDSRKLLRFGGWEIHKPAPADYAGFFGTWLLVGMVIGLLYFVVHLGGD